MTIRSRRARWVCAAALAFAWSPLSSANAVESDVLVVRGTAPGYVDVRTTKPLSFDLKLATYKGGGPYTGVFVDRIQPSTPILTRLGVLHRTLTTQGAPTQPDVFGYAEPQFPAGVYRLYLLGSGSSSVTIPVEGLGSGRIVATTARFPVSYREAALNATLSPDADALYQATTRLPVTLGSRPLLYQRVFVGFRGPMAQRHALAGCLPPPIRCEYIADLVSVAGLGEVGVSHAIYADAEEAPPGNYDAIAMYRGSRVPDRSGVALLTSPLSAAPARISATLGPPGGATPRASTKPPARGGPALPATGGGVSPYTLALALVLPCLVVARWKSTTH